eukprot:TRINITY_DN9039_c0_g1_i4.p1 TRINITY_DN9039_c0_g1~~TRINITY_DN9039_c0_g1_i4.p1  ORF type:complete len:177 (+),score=40.62 TRINITY_DN9039_c0_g1_i4:143-673(+)
MNRKAKGKITKTKLIKVSSKKYSEAVLLIVMARTRTMLRRWQKSSRRQISCQIRRWRAQSRMCAQKCKACLIENSKPETQLPDKAKMKEEERKRLYEDDRKMLEHSARAEKEYQDTQAAKREQLKKIQQENLQAAILKKSERALHKITSKENLLSLIHICRCRRYAVCRSRWSPYH